MHVINEQACPSHDNKTDAPVDVNDASVFNFHAYQPDYSQTKPVNCNNVTKHDEQVHRVKVS